MQNMSKGSIKATKSKALGQGHPPGPSHAEASHAEANTSPFLITAEDLSKLNQVTGYRCRWHAKTNFDPRSLQARHPESASRNEADQTTSHAAERRLKVSPGPLPSRSCVRQEQDDAILAERGSVAGIANALRTSTVDGLDAGTVGSTSLEARVRVFGVNRFKQVPQKTFFGLLWANLQDPIIILLMAAAMVS